jgi:1-deoxyxylulose-5-phosphate synthase
VRSGMHGSPPCDGTCERGDPRIALMERRRLGRTDVEVSRIILGCGNFGGIGSAPELFGRGETEEEAFGIMDAAWDLGITTFDTADAYGGGASERAIGNWQRGRGRRPEIVTKTYNPMARGEDKGLGRARVTRQLESSLERLGVDKVAVYLAHEFDPDTPLEQTVATFEELVQTGLAGAWGVSNFDAEQLRATLAIGRPTVVQNSYSLLERGDEEELLILCADFGISYTPFGPLAGGWLTGKYKADGKAPSGSRMDLRPEPYERFRNAETFAALEKFAAQASRHTVDTATLAVAWVLAQPQVTAVVVGPRRPEHLEPVLRALDLQVSPSEADDLAELFE